MRSKKHEEHENHERWLVSYADFITLLFAFFVVLYATSTQNESKQKKFESSIRSKMSFSFEGQGLNSGSVLGSVIEPIDLFQKRNVGNGELHDYLKKILRENLTEEERKEAIARLSYDVIGVRISLPASTLFTSGSSRMNRQAVGSLDKVAKLLKSGPHKIVVEGHTDDAPVMGKEFESNWELGSARATAVVRYLIGVHGFQPKRLSAVSYADTRPIESNDTPEHREHNRRIEILIVNNNLEPIE